MISNQINGKQYIGITTQAVRARFVAHCSLSRRGNLSPICCALRKYGMENFTIDHIASSSSLVDLKQLEKILIKQFNTKSPNGYNQTDGGDGMWGYVHTEEWKINNSLRMKGIKLSEEIKKRMSDAQKLRYTLHPEDKKIISDRMKIRTISHRTRMAISIGNKGKIISETTREKIRQKAIGRPRSAEHIYNLKLADIRRIGAKRTEDQKRRIHEGKRAVGYFIFTEDQVAMIKLRLMSGERNIDIARDYGVHKSHIGGIKRAKTWPNIMPYGMSEGLMYGSSQ